MALATTFDAESLMSAAMLALGVIATLRRRRRMSTS